MESDDDSEENYGADALGLGFGKMDVDSEGERAVKEESEDAVVSSNVLVAT